MLAKDSNFKEDDRVFPHYKCYYFMPHTNKTSLWYQLTLALGIGSLESSGVQYQYGVLYSVNIEEGFIQKRRQRSSLLLGGTELIQFLVVLAILHLDDVKNWMKSSFSSIHPSK